MPNSSPCSQGRQAPPGREKAYDLLYSSYKKGIGNGAQRLGKSDISKETDVSVQNNASSRAYAFGREMVCSQKSVRNRNFFENAGHVSFSFCQTGSAETHTKPCKTSPQGTSIKRPAIYWDHAVSWGGGVWVRVSDIGRVGRYWSGWQKNGVAPHSYIFPVEPFFTTLSLSSPRITMGFSSGI